MTDEKKKEFEYVQDGSLKLTSMQWEENKERLVIETDKGRVTCKPKKEVKEMIKGMTVIKTVALKVDELPQKVFDLIQIINEKGFVNVTASYQVMITEADGEEVKYRFLNSIKQIEKWEVVEGSQPSSVPVEKITSETIDKIKSDAIDVFNDIQVRQAKLFQRYQNNEITATEYTVMLRELQ